MGLRLAHDLEHSSMFVTLSSVIFEIIFLIFETSVLYSDINIIILEQELGPSLFSTFGIFIIQNDPY